MEPSKAAMKAALRVLTALSERRKPDQSDLDELHWYAPADRPRPVDELVCEAIQRALKDREEKRKAAKAQLREQVLAFAGKGSEARPEVIEVESLAREHARRLEEYRVLTAKLRRLGIVLQQAAVNITDSAAAKAMLDAVARDVDLSGITALLREHARLTRRLQTEEEELNKRK